MTEPRTMGDLFDRHATDCPDCRSPFLNWIKGESGPVGYCCPACGWEYRYPDGGAP